MAEEQELLTFGGHLEVFRQMVFRVLGVAGIIAIVIFSFKDITWQVLMAPSEWDFCTYRWIESAMNAMGFEFRFDEFYVNLIATDLSSQFMTHYLVLRLIFYMNYSASYRQHFTRTSVGIRCKWQASSMCYLFSAC